MRDGYVNMRTWVIHIALPLPLPPMTTTLVLTLNTVPMMTTKSPTDITPAMTNVPGQGRVRVRVRARARIRVRARARVRYGITSYDFTFHFL